jgi:hypothetical protein
VPWIHLPIAVIAAHRGQLELARAHSERSLQLGEEQIGLHTPVHLGTLGIVALQDGDPHAALDWFGRSEATTTRLGWGEAGKRWWVPDHVEALLALDRPDDAERVLDAWEADARRLERDWVLAHVTRCRGLVAAARGEVSEAASLLEHAVTQHETVGDAFGRARALLALGVVRRRERQKRAARDAIGAALGEFERLGAATWIERARAELGRIGGRHPRGRPDRRGAPRRRRSWPRPHEQGGRRPRCSSASGRWRRTCPMCTPSSACARGPSSRGGSGRTSKAQGNPRFQAEHDRLPSAGSRAHLVETEAP